MHIQVCGRTYTEAERLIQDFLPFIVKTVSTVVKRYITPENDDEFSIGVHAFYEAAKRYTAERGEFLSFAKIVIRSRVLNFLESGKKEKTAFSLDDEAYQHITASLESQFGDPALEKENVIADEIELLNVALKDFHFSLEDLASCAPKHQETRNRAILIGETVQKDVPLKEKMYEKKRLPVTEISRKYSFTEKILKGSKHFIITVIVIIDRKLKNLRLWLKKK